MKYTCVDPSEYLYPDITAYKSGTESIHILTPRGSYACAQIFLFEGEGTVSIECEGWAPEIYEMVPIPVEENIQITDETRTPYTPVRNAPFEVFDCLKPYDGCVSFKNGVAAVYFSLPVPQDAPAGIVRGFVKIGSIRIPVTVEISRAAVPPESLSVLLYYVRENVSRYHNVQTDSDAFNRLETAYLTMLRRMHQNALWIPENDHFPVVTALGDDRYDFDFTEMASYIRKAFALGYKRIYHRLGYRKSWEESAILVHGLPSTSYEGYCWLAQYLTALHRFLKENGWLESYMLSVLDEPREVNAAEYRSLCNTIRKFAPGIKLIDAISFGFVDGSIDICVPLSEEFENHRSDYETYRRFGDEIWYYDCCGPRGRGYINRFMDYPLLATRYHGWANYAYNLTGYLHWAANHYQPNHDPFRQSCPLHRNTNHESKMPAGDTHIMYPGTDGPWMSVRMENQRAGYEEYEMLRALACRNKELADTICAAGFRSFRDVEYDPLSFRTARNALIRALEAVQSEENR